MTAAKGVADAYPLTPSQIGILFDSLRDPDPELYFEQVRFDLTGDIDLDALRRSWEATVLRHPVLRTIWLWQGLDDPVQVVRDRAELAWTELDWSGRSDDEAALDALARDDRRRGFDLSKPPLTRITIVRLADDRVHLVWSFHHIMLDGWSTALVLDEVLERYEGRDVAAPRPFRDHVAWIRSQDGAAAETHWRSVLDGFDRPTRLAVDTGPSDAPFRLARSFASLDPDATERLVAAARAARVTLNTLVQSAWATVLSCHSGDGDVVFGVTGSGRPPEIDGVESMVGMFLSTLPMRVRFDPDRSVTDLWTDLQRQQLDLTHYQYSSLADIARWSNVSAETPLFDTALVFENFPRPEQRDRRVAVERHRVFEQATFPLTLLIGPGDRLEALALFDEARFGTADVERLLDDLFTVLNRMTDDPAVTQRQISVIDQDEASRLLVDLNRTDHPIRGGTVHAAVARWASERPDAVAVVAGERTVTFAELHGAATHLAGRIRTAGVAPGEAVVVSVPRSIDSVVAMLAVMRCGAAYVPLDPMTPSGRRQAIIDDADASLLVTTSEHLAEVAEVAELGTSVLEVDAASALTAVAEGAEREHAPDSTAADDVDPDAAMFVVFTSGSTGRPKGVPGSHRAVLNRCGWQARIAPFEPDEVACQKTTIEFVDHVAETWAPLIAGRPIVIIPDATVRDPDAFVAELARHRVRRIVMVPSLLSVLLDTIDDLGERLPELRLWTLSGERLPRALADRFRSAVPHARLLNVYGMSEAMADATCFDGSWSADDTTVPIGRPIDNQRVYVLDDVGRPTPIGVPGEIFVSGAGLASGYWRRDDLTLERFSGNPYGSGLHGRRYATGDLGRWNADGQLEYLGRVDRQVKVRGIRVELGDVEAAVAAIDGVREVAVVDATPTSPSARLVAHVVTDDDLDLERARRSLADQVSDHLVPSRLHRVDELPLLPSGKIDRQTLERLEVERPTAVTPPVDGELAEMVAIWNEVLEADVVGPDDDFFDVGGHSIAGMRLLARIHRAHGVNLELSVLYRDATPRSLLARVAAIADGRELADEPAHRHLVPITTGRDEHHTLYCVHGAGGNVLNLRDLADALLPDWGVVGIQAAGVDGVTPLHTTLDEMCEAYITELLADRPDRPLFLAGFSGGGVIAYEMAVRLAARGRPVATLALLDTFHPSIRGRRRTIGEHAAALFRQGPAYLAERRRVRRQRRLYEQGDEIVGANTPADGPVPHDLRDVHLVNNIRRLIDGYDTPRYDHPMWVFAARDVRDVLRHAGPDRGWSRSAGQVHSELVPGGHDDLILGPHARPLADRLVPVLERAMSDAGAVTSTDVEAGGSRS